MEQRRDSHSAARRHGEKIEAIMDPATGWLHGWYFDLRLEEELARSRRYGYPVSLLVLRLPEEPASPEDAEDFKQRIAAVAQARLRRPDLPAVLGPTELAICLPHTDKAGAGIVADRVQKALRTYRPTIGIATAPDDARTPGALYAVAASLSNPLKREGRQAS